MKAGSRTRRARRPHTRSTRCGDVSVDDRANLQHPVNLSPDGGAHHDESAPLGGADGGDLVRARAEGRGRVVKNLANLPVNTIAQPERIHGVEGGVDPTSNPMVHRDDGGGVEVGLDVVIGSAR